MRWQKAARREDGAVGGGQVVGEDGAVGGGQGVDEDGGGKEGLSLKQEKVGSPNFKMAGPDQTGTSPSLFLDKTAKHRYGKNKRKKKMNTIENCQMCRILPGEVTTHTSVYL